MRTEKEKEVAAIAELMEVLQASFDCKQLLILEWEETIREFRISSPMVFWEVVPVGVGNGG